MRLARWCLGATGALGLAAVIGIPLAAPALAALACPGCYGLTRIAPGLYSDAGAPPDLAAMVSTAQRTAAGALGAEALPTATVMICNTADCDARLGGKGALARAYGTLLIVVGPDGRNDTILTHEFAHIVIADALGTWGMVTGKMPYWMNEGLAVLASDDARYLAPGPTCLIEPDAPLPATFSAWNAVAGQTHATLYPQAACAVLRDHGPPPYDLADLLKRLP